jgi:hypothetical protein
MTMTMTNATVEYSFLKNKNRHTAVFDSNLARPNYAIGYPVLDE